MCRDIALSRARYQTTTESRALRLALYDLMMDAQQPSQILLRSKRQQTSTPYLEIATAFEQLHIRVPSRAGALNILYHILCKLALAFGDSCSSYTIPGHLRLAQRDHVP